MAAKYNNVDFLLGRSLECEIKICGRVRTVDSTRDRHPVFFFFFLLQHCVPWGYGEDWGIVG